MPVRFTRNVPIQLDLGIFQNNSSLFVVFERCLQHLRADFVCLQFFHVVLNGLLPEAKGAIGENWYHVIFFTWPDL